MGTVKPAETYIDDGPSLRGVTTIEEAKKARKRAPAIPMSVFSAAFTHYLLKKHNPEFPVSPDINELVPNPRNIGHRSFYTTIQAGKVSFNAERQRLQHVRVTCWARDSRYAHMGISSIEEALKKNIRGREISMQMKDKDSGLFFIEFSGYYYTLVKNAESTH